MIEQIQRVGQEPGVVRDTLAQSRVQTQTTVEQLKKEKNALERAILGHYERLNQAIADGANESAFADIQDQIREKELRVSEIVDEITSLSSLLIDESDVPRCAGAIRRSLESTIAGRESQSHAPDRSTQFSTMVTARSCPSRTTP